MNPYLEILIRAAGAFAAVIFIARMVGRAGTGELSVVDWISGIVIGVIAANLIVSLNEPAGYYVFGLLLFMILVIAYRWAGIKYRPLHKILAGNPTVVVHNGKILEDNLSMIRYAVDDLNSQLRQKGAYNIADVEYAIVEPNGRLSVLLKSQVSPLTPQDLNVPTGYKGVPSELVVDGVVIKQNLRQNNLDEDWLLGELQKQGIQSLKEVFYASLDTDGNLYVDKKQDDLDYVQDLSDKLPGEMPQ